jgi:hypothetical protein
MVAATKAKIEKFTISATDGDMIKATAISIKELEMRNKLKFRLNRTFNSGQLPKKAISPSSEKGVKLICLSTWYSVFCFWNNF